MTCFFNYVYKQLSACVYVHIGIHAHTFFLFVVHRISKVLTEQQKPKSEILCPQRWAVHVHGGDSILPDWSCLCPVDSFANTVLPCTRMISIRTFNAIKYRDACSVTRLLAVAVPPGLKYWDCGKACAVRARYEHLQLIAGSFYLLYALAMQLRVTVEWGAGPYRVIS